MHLPVDIKAILEEATNIDEARVTALSVAVFIDESAPSDLQAFVRREFVSDSDYANVNIVSFPTFPFVVVPGADIAVIVAGLDENVGHYASLMRDAGVPTMIISSLPRLAIEIAYNSGFPLLDGDLVAPIELPSPEDADLDKGMPEAEPLVLDDDRIQFLRKRMGEWVIDVCRDNRLAFAFAFGFVRKPLSFEAVRSTSAQNAGVGLLVFIPGADMPIMTLNQAKMLLQIAAAYGQPMTVERVKELAFVVGGGFAMRSIARQLVGVVPALGWAIKAGIGYAGTMAMGTAAVEYFEAGGTISGLAQVAGEARDKVMNAASKEGEKGRGFSPKNSASRIKRTAQNAVKKTVPKAKSAGRAVAKAVSDVDIPQAVNSAVTGITDAVRQGK